MKTVEELLGVATFAPEIQEQLDAAMWNLTRPEMEKFASSARAEMQAAAAEAVEWEACEEDCAHVTCTLLHGLADVVRGLEVA